MITISRILDEEDQTPVLEVKNDKGFATNAVTEEDALKLVRELLKDEFDVYRLTDKDFAEDSSGDVIYIGPLQIAIDFIKGPNKSTVEISRTAKGGWRVELDEGNVFGQADTQELAWRYALGAEFGPLDENFVPFMLHR